MDRTLTHLTHRIEAAHAFNIIARRKMDTWNVEQFKYRYPKLYDAIITSMVEFKLEGKDEKKPGSTSLI